VAERGVNPADAERVLKVLRDTWELASERMLDTVARRLARGITAPGWAEQKAREVLALRGELAGVLARAEQATPEAVFTAMDEAYRIGEGAAGVLEQTHIRSRPEVVQRLATRLVSNLQGAHLPVISSHVDLFRRAVSDSELLMQTGTMTRRDAVAKSVDKLLAQGQDRFADAAGRRWHLDAYTRMAGRTMAGQSMVQGQLDGMVDRGRDLVVISDSPRECEMCRPWEGRLLSVSGVSVGQEVDGHRVDGTVAAARAAGLWHPNCTHRADPYTPGLTTLKPAKENPDGYQDQQKLRGYERNARDLKRRLATAEKLGATDEARKLRAKVRDNSARIKAHTEATGQLRKRDRERPVGGGGSQPIAAAQAPPTTTPTPTTSKPPASRRAPRLTDAQRRAQRRELEQIGTRLDRDRAAFHAERVVSYHDRKYRKPLHEILTNAFEGVPENKVARLRQVEVVSQMQKESVLAQYLPSARVMQTTPKFLARRGESSRSNGSTWFADVGDMELVEAILNHEFGHHLDHLLTRGQRERLFAEMAEADPTIIPVNITESDPWLDTNSPHIANTVGTYACTNLRELLAELWAQYRGNGPKSAIAQVVGRWFEADNLGGQL